jgi:hypothetical protein
MNATFALAVLTGCAEAQADVLDAEAKRCAAREPERAAGLTKNAAVIRAAVAYYEIAGRPRMTP